MIVVPKSQYGPKALYNMVFGPKSLKIRVLSTLEPYGSQWYALKLRSSPHFVRGARLSLRGRRSEDGRTPSRSADGTL